MTGVKGRKPEPTDADSAWYAPDDVDVGSVLYVDTDRRIRGLTPGAAATVIKSSGLTPAIPAYGADATGAGGTVIEAKASRSTNQTVAASTWTAVAFDLESYDTDGIHSTASNTSRFTVATAGTYALTGWWQATAAVGSYLAIGFRKNGTTFVNCLDLTAGRSMTITLIDKAAAGDYYELMAFATGGLTLDTAGAFVPTLVAAMVSGGGSSGSTTLAEATGAAVAQLAVTGWYSAAIKRYLLTVDNLTTSAGTIVTIQASTDGGATWMTTVGQYEWRSGFAYAGGAGPDGSTSANGIPLRSANSTVPANYAYQADFQVIDPGSTTFYKHLTGHVFVPDSTLSGVTIDITAIGIVKTLTPVNAFRLVPSAGTLTGTLRMSRV